MSDLPSSPRRPRRSKRAWMILLGVWLIGLAVWGVYLLMASMLVNRAMTRPE